MAAAEATAAAEAEAAAASFPLCSSSFFEEAFASATDRLRLALGSASGFHGSSDLRLGGGQGRNLFLFPFCEPPLELFDLGLSLGSLDLFGSLGPLCPRFSLRDLLRQPPALGVRGGRLSFQRLARLFGLRDRGFGPRERPLRRLCCPFRGGELRAEALGFFQQESRGLTLSLAQGIELLAGPGGVGEGQGGALVGGGGLGLGGGELLFLVRGRSRRRSGGSRRRRRRPFLNRGGFGSRLARFPLRGLPRGSGVGKARRQDVALGLCGGEGSSRRL